MSFSNPSSLGTDIQTAEIDDGAITTAKLAANAVTRAKQTGVTADPDKQYYPLSVTIGDYTTPSGTDESSTGALGSSINNAQDDSDGTGHATGKVTYDQITGLTVGLAIGECGCWVSNDAGGNIRVAIYTDNAGTPNTLLAESAVVDVSTLTTGAYNNIALTDQTQLVPAGGIVWVAIQSDTAGQNTKYKTGANRYEETHTWGAFPATASASSTGGRHSRSIRLFDSGGSLMIDDDTGTEAATSSETNPWLEADMGSTGEIDGVAIHLGSSNTVAEMLIQTSVDGVAWTTRRTITVSNVLTVSAWNYILFNRPTDNPRYIRAYGNDGGAAVLGINEMKVMRPTESVCNMRKGYGEISTTDGSLAADGGV